MLEKLPDALGHALRNQRAGLDAIAFNRTDLRQGTAAIAVTSLAFVDHAPIPALYTADGDGRSPPLQWGGLPEETGSVVLIVEDADAPTPKPLVHAIVVDLPPGDGAMAEGALSGGDHEEDGSSEERDGAGTDEPRTGRNSYLQSAWLPPDPPPGHGVHRYAFQVFALSPGAVFSENPGRDEVLELLGSHAIASGLLIGTYERDHTVKVDDADAVPLGGGAQLA
ncbi:YbhB/YbcL family Raf kinase inhibitor-like protein [Xylophilus rhododendri]|uniref:YbhB/YbcL family Raf kinase inhibitor-like protein n=1 Tax=Xylophilus rhododendri TaxID=2697032 RepID=A0A857J161_9BURK|nr:YbhB/YbcL family Raf kinase inhibitor-like protein [Xylophilus rhododendri]QHI96615.1 YbhB/YbcL family Raf kinase inhibitor-like protein [Xylophilus rhododendri]